MTAQLIGTRHVFPCVNEIENQEFDPNGIYLCPDSATTILTSEVFGLDAAQRNPGIGDMVNLSPYFAALHTGYV